MNPTQRDTNTDATAPADAEAAEARLQASRARMRASLETPATGGGTSPTGDMLTHLVKPAAGEFVRRHPVASLAGAALAGALLVRVRPLGGLIGSVATTILVRRLADAASHWIDESSAADAAPARVSASAPTAAPAAAAAAAPDAEP
ncbi:MAG: hypothetical protein KDG52_19295 [Rhodocyclaceae bacterium]|nr:hypothetical protein [Rhodocyclaceae bacterium]